MDEKFLFEYDHEIARKKTENSIREEFYEDGIQQGIEQGKNDQQIETAKKMLEDKIEISIISKYTGLSILEAERLCLTND